MAQGTYAHQGSLPKLPVPGLAATCEKYLRTVEPLLSPAQLEATRAAVAQFQGGDGPALQARLEEHAKQVDSYVEAWWTEAYTHAPCSLALNINPIFVLEDDPTPSRNNQLARASSLILSSIKFVRMVKQEILAPDMVRKTPLCMSQFKALFSTARLPVFAPSQASDEPGEFLHDEIKTFEHARHILVMSRGQFYYFDVIWPDGTPAITQREICRNLERILEDSRRKTDKEVAQSAVGVLTAEERATWAKIRHRLQRISASNRKTLEMIDSALFVVCLDNVTLTDPTDIANNILAGTYNVRDEDCIQTGTCLNRWFDKLQIVVTESGNAGINFEHSAVDGHTVLRFASDVFTDTIIRFAQTISGQRVHSFIGESSAAGGPSSSSNGTHKEVTKAVTAMRRPETRPRKLELDLDALIQQDIRYAEGRLSDAILQNDAHCLEFVGYGKQFIVQNGMSPDAFAQLAMLSAYYTMYGRLVNTYESVQTKAFLHGRTEAARSATSEAAAFLKSWTKPGLEPSKKLDALRKALAAHSSMTKEAAQGYGVDRHLFALCELYKQENPGAPLPKIFQDLAYQILGTNTLSTSNCGNPSLRFFGFGPVTPQGFGIGYIIKDDAMHFMITSKHRQSRRFATCLSRHLGQVQDLILELDPPMITPRELQVARADPSDNGYGFFGDFEESLPTPSSPVGRALRLNSDASFP